jgi:hypothetical protein
MSRTYWLEYEKGKGYNVYEEYVDGINEDAFQVIDKEFYDDLAEINRDNRKHAQELGLCVDILTRKNNELTKELDYYKEMELRYNQLLEDTSAKQLVELQERVKEQTHIIHNLLDYGPPSAMYENSYAHKQDIEIEKLKGALNRIGILGMGELAYTSDFTEKVNGIVKGVLK